MKKLHRGTITVTLATFFTVLALSSIAYAAGEKGITASQWENLALRAIHFIILTSVLVWLLKKPISNGLKGRQQSIEEQFSELEALKAEAKLNYKKYEAKLARIDDEVSSIIKAAVEQGEAEKEQLIADAKRTAEDIKRKADMAVQYELITAKTTLRSEIAGQAVLVAEELIKKSLKPADHSKTIEEYLDKVGTNLHLSTGEQNNVSVQ